MTVPECPHHGPMKKVTVEYDGRIIGYLWFCVNDDSEKPDYCDNCEDCDDPIPTYQMNLVLDI